MLVSFARALAIATALFAANPQPTALHQEGTRAYRAGRYEDALAKFRAAAERDHDDPDALADVALALQKLGRTAEAITVNQSVIRLAAHPSADRAKRFTKARMAAYLNLGRLGAIVGVPDVGACGSVATATDTCKQLFACREAHQNNGSGLATLWEVLRIARTKEAAILDEDDYHEMPPLIRGLTDAEYDSEAGRPAIDLLPEQEGDTILRYGTEEVGDECRRIYGDWSCDTSDEVRAETRRCQGSATAKTTTTGTGGAPTPAPDDASATACYRLSCDRAESAPWPAVQTEIDRRAQRLSSCYGRLGQLDDTTCAVVFADPCSGLVGTYCTTAFHRTAKPRAEHHRVFELTAPQD
jgi:tetratricopeptide (TPR) repeat protein